MPELSRVPARRRRSWLKVDAASGRSPHLLQRALRRRSRTARVTGPNAQIALLFLTALNPTRSGALFSIPGSLLLRLRIRAGVRLTTAPALRRMRLQPRPAFSLSPRAQLYRRGVSARASGAEDRCSEKLLNASDVLPGGEFTAVAGSRFCEPRSTGGFLQLDERPVPEYSGSITFPTAPSRVTDYPKPRPIPQ